MERHELSSEPSTRTWVLLVKSEIEGKSVYAQSGPFTANEVLERIRSGEAQYSDHVWKQGFSQWVRVGDLTDFGANQEAKVEISLEVAAPETSQLLSHVLEQIATQPTILEEEVPAETNRVDETKLQPLFSLSQTDKTDFQEDPAVRAETFQLSEEVTFEDKVEARVETPILQTKVEPQAANPFRKTKKNYTPALIALSLGVALIFVWLQTNKAQTEAIIAEAKRENPTVETKTQKPSVVAQAKSAFLNIAVLGAAENKTKINFDTDLQAGQLVKVDIRGKRGDILDRYGYRATFHLIKNENQALTLDLSQANLPNGRYQVVGESGKVRDTVSFFVGKDNADFAKDLKSIRAQVAAAQVKERDLIKKVAGSLARDSRELESQFKKLRKKTLAWKNFYSKFQKNIKGPLQIQLQRMDVSQKDKFFYPDTLSQLKSARNRLIERGKTLNKKINAKGTVASSNLEREFISLAKKAN